MTYLAAAVQRAPGLTREQGVDNAVAAIEEAGREGASLIVFPETWIPSYPYYHGQSTHRQAFTELYSRTFEHSISIPGDDWSRIAQAAADASAHVVIGVNEREPQAGTIYNTLAYIGPDGALLGKHRKLVPTLSERLIWGYGDGSDLDVYDTDTGRLGGLICYEHQMAPARYALSTLGIQVHASVWPGWEQLDPVIDAATRHLAYENACHVIVARETMSPDLLPSGTPLAEEPFWHASGGSAIIAPGGKYLVEPVTDRETIIYAEIDLNATIESKRWVDSAGHYARPDVFQLHWDKRPKPPVVIDD
ncbi:MAG: carbon-nitrogen hydrolase family protein [Chloroflexi bacterium]|nr:carbon-nitrogen hydrolase family protein [Chloroflexota bacterium]